MRHWHTVSHHTPCLICDKPDWWRSVLMVPGRSVAASTPGQGCHKVDKAGADYWLYRLDGHAPVGNPA